MLKLASRVQALQSSSIMDIAAQAAGMKARGIDVVSLAAGEPDFNTPIEIQNAATKAMADGITKYTPSSGFAVLREAIAKKVTEENGFPVKPEEVLITSGAKMALYLALQTLVEAGDAVLVPTPGWVSYHSMIELTGATMIPLPMYEEDGFNLNIERWKGLAIKNNARGVLINSPNNPTGVAYSKEEMKKFVGWALQRGLWILSDEIYEKILYDGAEHISVASLGPEVRNHTITVSGFSKSHCMTGWRLGWAIGPEDVIKKMSALQSQSTSHVTSFVQWAGLTAASLPASKVQEMVDKFDERRKYCLGRLEKMKDHVSFHKPNSAFYFFLNFSKHLTKVGKSDVQMCKELLTDHHVATIPGSSFGKDKFMRISYATNIDNLKKAFDRLEKYLGA